MISSGLKYSSKSTEILLLVVVFSLFGILYFFQLTTSGLWFDECIEYFYSKYMTGDVPVNPVNQSGNNMYERICITYQPPLYNVLMYFWLSLFDNESWFRLAGVLTTFIGSLGFYFSIRRISNYIWGIFGLCLYLSTAVIVFYAVECAEYNLMLCMESWILYYYVASAQSARGTVGWCPLIGFFLFAALAVYSQYGAAFFVLSLFLSLCYIFIKAKNFEQIYRTFFVGIVTFFVAIIPLVYFFIRVQMANQGSVQVDHRPVFVGSLLGGIPYSFFKSFYEQVVWIFSSALVWGDIPFQMMRLVVVVMFICTFIVVFLKNRFPVLRPIIMATVLCYLLFFISSAFSYYAYNSWDGSLGCYNIVQHTRYVLFIVPLLVFMLVVGVISFCRFLINVGYYKIAFLLIVGILVPFVAHTAWGCYKGRIKSDGREATYVWLNKHDFRHKIVVQEWVSGIFMYYLQHSDVYYEVPKDIIILTKQDMRMPENIEDYLRNLGVFNLSSFYFIGRVSTVGVKDETFQEVCKVFVRNGYKVQYLWKNSSALLFISRIGY